MIRGHSGPGDRHGPWLHPDEFLTELYSESAAELSDAANLHPYTDPYQGTGTLIDRVAAVRMAMDEGGASDQLLWITEIGYPTGFQYWSEQLMAEWLIDSFDTLRAMEGIGPIVWYNFRDKGTDPDDPEHHFGLVERHFTPKLTYHSYRDYIVGAGEWAIPCWSAGWASLTENIWSGVSLPWMGISLNRIRANS